MAQTAPYLILFAPRNPTRSFTYHLELDGSVCIIPVGAKTLGAFVMPRERADRHSAELVAAGYRAYTPIEDLRAAVRTTQPATGRAAA